MAATTETHTLATDPEAECIMLMARLALLQAENIRLSMDKDSLPPGWHAVRIDDNTVRINAIDDNGNYCHWILCTESNT
jgi:hypothetical protein